jgi:hypothetical protein
MRESTSQPRAVKLCPAADTGVAVFRLGNGKMDIWSYEIFTGSF